MTTNVPAVALTDQGYVPPTEAAVLAGVQADFNAAFGGSLNPGASTPQGQLATTESATIGNSNGLLAAVFNGIDPAYASGRMQDAIARIYFLTRIPSAPTILTLSCVGLAGTVIPQFALVQDSLGNQYYAQQAGTVGAGGTVALPFANTINGPIPAPVSVTPYQAVSGWESASVSSSVLGNAVESRAAFAQRMSQSVAGNSLSPVQAVQASVLSLLAANGGGSAYTTENTNGYAKGLNPDCQVVGTISGTTLTVASTTFGSIANGQLISLAADGVAGVTLPSGLTIVSGSGPYTISSAATVPGGTTINLGGVQLKGHSLYCCVYGPEATEIQIGQAVWAKKGPGCSYNGNTTVTVYDTSFPYPPPGVPYNVTYQAAATVPIYIAVAMVNSSAVPANALALVQQAIADAFSGEDGGQIAVVGWNVLATRFMSGIQSLGAWAQVLYIAVASTLEAAAATSTSTAIAGTVMTVGGSLTGTFVAGQYITGANVLPGTYIVSLGSGSGGAGTYNVNQTQTAAGAAVNAYAITANNVQMTVAQMPTFVTTDVILKLF